MKHLFFVAIVLSFSQGCIAAATSNGKDEAPTNQDGGGKTKNTCYDRYQGTDCTGEKGACVQHSDGLYCEINGDWVKQDSSDIGTTDNGKQAICHEFADGNYCYLDGTWIKQ